MSDTAVFYNPFAEGFTSNPYPHYAELRAGDPVHQSPIGAWIVFGYDNVRSLLRRPDLSVEDRNAHATPLADMAREAMGGAAERGNNSMLGVDPPQHTRLRRLVSATFTPRMIGRLRTRIEDIVDATLDDAERRGEMELMTDLAFRLPFTVITELLGMPPTDTVELRRLSGTMVRSLEPVVDLEVLKAIGEAGQAMEALIRDAIKWKRESPADDLLSGLIAAEEDGDVLSELELIDQVMLLYLAGHETTVNLIGNGMLGLLRHPDQMALLHDDPSLADAAVEELLRYDSPVQMSRRVTLDELSIGGKTIEPGAFVVLGLGSSNRDEDKWGPTADKVDLRREGASEHLSFGGGHHHCLGAALARLEGQVAIGHLVRRFATIEATAEPVWNGRINLRGVTSLPLKVA